MITTLLKRKKKLVRYGVEYPKQDSQEGHHPHFVKYPVTRIHHITGETQWVAVHVFKDGHSSPKDPALNPFETEQECSKACDLHNRYHGWNKKQVLDIVARSMGKKSWD